MYLTGSNANAGNGCQQSLTHCMPNVTSTMLRYIYYILCSMQQGSLSGHKHMSFLIINGTACNLQNYAFLIMKMVRNVFPNYDYRGRNVFLIRGRNVFPKYEEGARRLF